MTVRTVLFRTRRFSRSGILVSLIGAALAAAPASGSTPPRFLLTWGTEGTAIGQFDAPYHIALDPAGYLYVTDSENSRIQKFDANGNPAGVWGSLGSQPGQLNIPSGITVHNGKVYVGDASNHQVEVFTTDGGFISRFGTIGSDPGVPGTDPRFYFPIGVAVDDDGFIYVADSWNNRVQKLDANGKFVLEFGGTGTRSGKFNLPTGIALDSKGHLVVCDTKNNRVQIFDRDGTWLQYIGKGSVTEGSLPGQFNLPYAVDIGPNGDIYICDSGNDRVQVFDPDGAVILTFGQTGTEPGDMDLPWGIAVGGDGTIFISDANNDRMEKFGPMDVVPTLPSTWGKLKQAYLPH